jgi:hypothetical protein
MPSTQQAAPAPPKKGKGKKATDPSEQQKQIQAKIAQLELDAAGDREQEAEIEREVKKANRELSHLLNGMETPMSRLEAVQKRYTELLQDMKRTERDHIKAKKRGDQLQKEKDAQKTEMNKVVAMKDKLEKLSRDLTKENKKLKEDVHRISMNESRAKEELHNRLERMVADVEAVINSQDLPDIQPPAEVELDELFRQKFKNFIDQYELRELQFHSLLRTKELEIQYQMARLEQQRKQQELESSKSHQLTRQVSTFSQTETELRTQLNIYVEKFKQMQVEETLNNSNDLFLTFRKEMEEMSKKTKRLEKQNDALTRNKEATNRNILEMAEERTKMQKDLARKDKELELLKKKNENLEKLCRGMQAQGRGQVNMNDIEEDEEATESEYDYEEDEQDDSGAEYDDDTEEDALENVQERRPFGPVPPPPPPPQSLVNGNGAHGQRQTNGQANGTRH